MIPELALAYLVASQPAPSAVPGDGVASWEYTAPSTHRCADTLSVSIRKTDPASRHLKVDLPPNILIDTQAEGLQLLCSEPRGPRVTHRIYSMLLNQARYLVVISTQTLQPKGSRLDVSIYNERSATKHGDADEWKCWRTLFAARPGSRA